MKICRFALKPTEHQEIRMPVGARIIRVSSDDLNGFVWCECKEGVEIAKRSIRLVATEQSFECIGVYVGTFSVAMMTFHVYDEGEK